MFRFAEFFPDHCYEHCYKYSNTLYLIDMYRFVLIRMGPYHTSMVSILNCSTSSQPMEVCPW